MRVVACAGIVARNAVNEIVLVERTEDRAWAVPGGRLEPGENWRECALREFSEETGLAARITGLLGVYSDPTTQRHQYAAGDDVQFVGVVFEGITDGTSDRAPDAEIHAVRFFAPSALPTRVFGPDREVIEDACSDATRPLLK